jgi:SAM-dependent methyltransferase
MSQALHLLPPEALLKTGEVDHANWNHRPVIGAIQRLRYKLVLSLLGASKFEKLLEVGYGSGVFMPELSRRCEELYGIDIHRMSEDVTGVLANHDVKANLFTASVTELPFEDRFFDGVVTVSSLEFVEDIDRACREIKRVLSPDGVFVVITPGYSRLVDLGLKVLTGEDPKKDFGDRREKIIPALLKHFVLEKQLLRPHFINSVVHLYTGLRLGLKK